MEALIQLFSIVLIMLLALPGTTILWSGLNPTSKKFKAITALTDTIKSQFLETFIPGLRRLAAMFF